MTSRKRLFISVAFGVCVAVSGAAAQGQGQGKMAAAAPDVHRDAMTKKFKKADLNNDGMLDETELKAEAKVKRGPKAPPEGDDAHFAKVKVEIMVADKNKDGKISLQEYMAWAMEVEK